MATRFFFTNAASDIAISTFTTKVLSTTQPAGGSTSVTNTVLGPTAGVQMTATAGGVTLTWVTGRLFGFVFTPSAGANPTFNLRGLESSMNNNASFTPLTFTEVDDTGTAIQTLMNASDFADQAELGTVDTTLTYTPTGSPAAKAFNPGNRIHIALRIDDAAAVTMAAAGTMTFKYDGAAGGVSDSWVEFTETILPYNPPNARIQPHVMTLGRR